MISLVSDYNDTKSLIFSDKLSNYHCSTPTFSVISCNVEQMHSDMK